MRRRYERQATFQMPNTLIRDQTMREPVPKFDFPKLKPLDIEPRECIVCFQEERNTVLPCGHSLLCEGCTKLLLSRSQPCPNCRTHFSNYEVAEKQPTFRDFSTMEEEASEDGDEAVSRSSASPPHSPRSTLLSSSDKSNSSPDGEVPPTPEPAIAVTEREMENAD